VDEQDKEVEEVEICDGCVESCGERPRERHGEVATITSISA